MVQLSPCKDSPWMRSQLPVCTKSTCIIALSVLRRGQPDSRESYIMLQSGPTRSLVANFPHRSVVACKFCAAGKNAVNEAMDRCVRRCRGAQRASERSQLCELSGPTFGFTMQNFSMVGGQTENFEKPQNCQNLGVGVCTGMGTIWYEHALLCIGLIIICV